MLDKLEIIGIENRSPNCLLSCCFCFVLGGHLVLWYYFNALLWFPQSTQLVRMSIRIALKSTHISAFVNMSG